MRSTRETPLPASLHGAEDEWQHLVSAVMAHSGKVPDRLEAAFAKAPHSPTLLAAKGLIFMLLGRRELVGEARALHSAATQALQDVNDPHDKMMVETLGAWLAGRPSQSAATLDELQTRYPGDGFAVKMAQAIRFLYGDTEGMRRSAETAVPYFDDAHPHAGYVHGCFAFSCEETHDYAVAEKAGVRALELAHDDAWALHAVAHVHEMRGHPEKGRNWLKPRQDCIKDCTTFRHHVWWHYALFELELGNVERVLDLYDTEIRRDHTDDYRDISNAVSLLARLEAEGIGVGKRWEELSEIAERRVEDGCIVFADLHYLMALLATDRIDAAERLVARMGEAEDGSEFGAVAAGTGAAAGTGLAALRRGDHQEALHALMTAQRQLQRIGGSHAQRDVFDRLTIDAALRAGHRDAARHLIKDRALRRGAFDRFAVARLTRCGPVAIEAPVSTASAF